MLIDGLTFDVVAGCQRKAGFRCICFRWFRCLVFVFFILPPNFSPYIVLTSNNNNKHKRSNELTKCANSDTRWRHSLIYLYKQKWVHLYICTYISPCSQKYVKKYKERNTHWKTDRSKFNHGPILLDIFHIFGTRTSLTARQTVPKQNEN